MLFILFPRISFPYRQLRALGHMQLLNCQTPLQLVGYYSLGVKKSLVRQFGAGGISTLSGHFYTVITILQLSKDSKCDYLHTIYILLLCWRLYFHTVSGLPLVCGPVKCLLIWYLLKVNKSAPQLRCRFVKRASQLALSICKSFHVPPFHIIYSATRK